VRWCERGEKASKRYWRHLLQARQESVQARACVGGACVEVHSSQMTASEIALHYKFQRNLPLVAPLTAATYMLFEHV
jgi:hypothetical protein